MGNWYIKVDEKPVLLWKVNNNGDSSWMYQLNGSHLHVKVESPNELEYVDLDAYAKYIEDEYKEMVLAVLDMNFAEMVECFGSGYYTCLRYILKDHPDPLGAYQSWKVKKDSAKEMTIEEIEAKLGYKIKVVGKEDK